MRFWWILVFAFTAEAVDVSVTARDGNLARSTCQSAVMLAGADALVRQIATDSLAALAYADFLEESGADLPLAEFIRVQVEIESLEADEKPNLVRLAELKAKERELWNKNGARWIPKALVHGTKYPDILSYRRGMVHRLRTTDLPYSLDQLVDAFPSVVAVNVLNLPESLTSNAKYAPIVQRLQELTLSLHRGAETGGGIRQSDVDALTTTTFPSLHTLNVDRYIGGQNLRRVVSATTLPNLRRLQLRFDRDVSDASVRTLVDSLVHPLEALQLHSSGITAAGARMLSGSAKLAGVRELNLASNRIGIEGLRSIAASAHLRLTTLNVSGNSLPAEATRVLTEERNFQNLVSLSVSDNQLGSGFLRAFVASPYLTKVRTLSLWRVGLASQPGFFRSTSDIDVLVNSRRAETLRSLDLSYNRDLGDTAALAIARSTNLGNLGTLNLTGTGLTIKGIRALANSKNLSSLHTIYVGEGDGSIAELRRIANSGKFVPN